MTKNLLCCGVFDFQSDQSVTLKEEDRMSDFSRTGAEIVSTHRQARDIAKEIGVSYPEMLHFLYKHEPDGSCRCVNCLICQSNLKNIQKYMESMHIKQYLVSTGNCQEGTSHSAVVHCGMGEYGLK